MKTSVRFGGRQTVVNRATGTPTEVRVFGTIAFEGVDADGIGAVQALCVQVAPRALAEVAPDLRALGNITEPWAAAILAALAEALAGQTARAVEVEDVTASVSG
jgi:hypothetical protein